MNTLQSKRCEICNSEMYEGELGEAWWICSNKECSRSDPNWPTEELMKKTQPKYDEIQNKINNLKALIIEKISAEVEIHTARWIADGSGCLKMHDRKIEFYFKEGIVYYFTDNQELITSFKEQNLDEHLLEVWRLTMEQLSLFR